MTEHEAITAIINRGGVMSKNNAGNDIAMGFIQAAITLMQYCVKYRWHDLRKNPEDLPENWYMVLFYTSYDDYKIGYVINCECSRLKGWYIQDDDEFEYCEIGSKYVIAWKDFEPFEEDDE